jgi:hypothetical protein
VVGTCVSVEFPFFSLDLEKTHFPDVPHIHCDIIDNWHRNLINPYIPPLFNQLNVGSTGSQTPLVQTQLLSSLQYIYCQIIIQILVNDVESQAGRGFKTWYSRQQRESGPRRVPAFL